MNPFNALVDDLFDAISRRDRARNARLARERDSRLAHNEFSMIAANIRGDGHRFAKAMAGMEADWAQMRKSCDSSDAAIHAAAAQTAARHRDAQRNAAAGKLTEIIAGLDKAIADGTVSADQVAILENMIHRAAARVGAI